MTCDEMGNFFSIPVYHFIRLEWGCVTGSVSASLLGQLQQNGQANLSSPFQQTQHFSSSHTYCLPHSDSQGSKTFYNCKQIIRVWLKSILAVLGLEIKAEAQCDTMKKARKEQQTDGFAITSVVS